MGKHFIRVRDKNLQFIGEVDSFLEFEYNLKYNDVGSWRLTIPYDSPQVEAFKTIFADSTDGGIGGIYVERETTFHKNITFMFSGPIRGYQEKYDENGHILEIWGKDELGILQDKLALPHPRKFQSPYMRISDGGSGYFHTDAYPNYNSPSGIYKASTKIYEFVRLNVAQDADPSRKVGVLQVVDNNNGYGYANYNRTRARGENLFDLVKGIVDDSEYRSNLSNGVYSFNPASSGNIMLKMYQDLTLNKIKLETVFEASGGDTVFDPELDNVISYTFSREYPTGNMVLCGGAGQGVNRYFAYAGDEVSRGKYGSIERFIEYTGGKPTDNSSDATAELIQHIYAELANSAERTRWDMKIRETPGSEFMYHYNLGSAVKVRLRGEETLERLREVNVKETDEGEEIDVVVGRQGAVSKGLRLFDKIRNFEYRFSGLDKRTNGE
jgi:hypothetical protein